MTRLAKYLKPYLGMIILTIALLFVQANADLALPDYLSRIVNVGIQQSGVPNAVPVVIRASSMDKVLLFLTPEEGARVKSNYTYVDQNSPTYEETVAFAPGAADEPVYTLNDVSRAEMDWLNRTLAPPEAAIGAIAQAIKDPARVAQMGKAMGFDLSSLPAGMDPLAVLGKLSDAQRGQIRAAIEKQFAALSDTAVEQAAVKVVAAEYESLGVDMARLQTQYILRTGAVMLLIALVSVACAVAVGYFSARTAAGAARDVRRGVFGKVESFSSAEFERFSTASLITRTTNDITQLQMVVIMMMRMVFYAPLIAIGGIIRAVRMDSSMWWIIAIGVGLLIGLVAIVFSLTMPRFQLMQKLIDRLNLVMRENLSGMMVIRAFNTQTFEEDRFDTANQDLTGVTLFVNRVMATMFPIVMLIMNGLSLLIIWVGAHQVAQAQMQVGDMMAFMQYAMQIVFAFLMMSFMFIIIPRASVSGNRVADVLETEPTIRDAAEPARLPEPFRGVVEFRDVAFRYPDADEDVLCGVSFTALPGQTTAFIGSTGSGKSTVVNLIPRFYDVTQGQILIDGVDIRSVKQHDLRSKIGYIPQKASLFSGTIESNLRYADENANPELIEQTAEIAQVQEFIASSAEGLGTPISQGGANVSGGQKQRLSIARALVKRAPIYIFDDSFSALDFKTDAALRRALRVNAADNTLLIVTQRVSTIMHADQIVVLDDGMVAGIGTHQSLMETCEPYREIALSQLSLEELS
jgi:ATP-binding cassette subfamily B protein